MEVIENIGSITSTVKSAVSGIDSVVDLLKKWRSYRISDLSTLKMLYLELDRDLELIEVLQLKSVVKLSGKSPVLFELLGALDVTVTGIVLAREEKYSVFRKVMKHGFLGRRRHRENKRDYENVLQALSFIHSKALILKQMGQLRGDSILKEIKLRERLSNLAESINLVLKVLVTFREVNVIARRWHRD